MNEFLQLYDEVLKSLPFSIKGRANHEKKLYDFYDKLANSNFFKFRNSKFTCLFSAINKIELKKGTSKLEWDVKSYDKFYYKTFRKVDKRAIVSIYYSILKKLSESETQLKPSFIFSQLFNEDLDFKLSLYKNKQNNPLIDYNKDIDLFEVKLPYSIFKETYHTIGSHHRLKLIKFVEQDDKFNNYIIDNPDPEHPRYYTLCSLPEKSHIFSKKVFNEILNKENTKEVINKITQDLGFFDLIFVKKLPKDLYKKFAKCCIALSYWCLHYDSAIEYMMSLASVEKKKNEKDEWYERRQNLGGLIIGYKKDLALSRTERTMLNLISDRLTVVVAGQMLHEENVELRRRNNLELQHQILKDFKKKCLPNEFDGKNLDHGGIAIPKKLIFQKNKFFERWDEQEFNKAGLAHFRRYVSKTYVEGQKVDKGFFIDCHNCELEIKDKHNLYKYRRDEDSGITNAEPIGNSVLIHCLIANFNKNEVKKIQTYAVTEHYPRAIFIRLDFIEEEDEDIAAEEEEKFDEVEKDNGEPISILKFRDSLNNDKGENLSSGGLGGFIINNFEALVTSFEIIIRDPNPECVEGKFTDESEILNFEKDLTLSTNNNGEALYCDRDLDSKNDEFDSLIYQLTYKQPEKDE